MTTVKHVMQYIHPVIQGGGEHLLVDLMESFIENSNIQNSIVLGCHNEYLIKECHKLGINIHVLKLFKSKQAYSKIDIFIRALPQIVFLAFIIIKMKPNILHLHSFPMQYFSFFYKGLALIRFSKMQVGFTKHIYSERGWLSKFFWLIAYFQLNFITGVSDASLRGIGLHGRSNSFIIFNPASVDFYGVSTEKPIPGPLSLTAIIACRIAVGKGHTELFKYIKSIPPLPYKLNLRIIGSGPLENVVREKAFELMKLNSSVSINFVGFLDKESLLLEFANSDFAIHPSYNEGFSLLCAQYYVSGLPTICNNYAPSYEVFGKSALYYNSKKQLEKCLIKFYSHDLRDRLSNEMLKTADKFALKPIAQKYLDIYNA